MPVNRLSVTLSEAPSLWMGDVSPMIIRWPWAMTELQNMALHGGKILLSIFMSKL